MKTKFDISFAQHLDSRDSLSSFRNRFYFPSNKDDRSIYFTGHSLGLQPKNSTFYFEKVLQDWKLMGVDGHFHASTPWFDYHKTLTRDVAHLVGAQDNEVVTMNGLSVNLHLLLTSFYQPTNKKHKIICEPNLFPSDLYVLRSQIELRGYDPDESIIFLPTDQEGVVLDEDLYNLIESHKEELALVFLGGVNYYTGQVYNIKKITQFAHKYEIMVGFDLAHAAGNIELKLHEWGVDFAAWCSYKYLNSGPGNVSSIFIHENQIKKNPFRLSAWWGHLEKDRFSISKQFQPINSAEGWQLSNAPIFGMSIYRASLEIFNEIGISNLVAKRIKLSAYLEEAISLFNLQSSKIKFKIITPGSPEQRGAQLSITINFDGYKIYNSLKASGVYVDWRKPNVMRIATVPLYNSYEDIARFYHILLKCI